MTNTNFSKPVLFILVSLNALLVFTSCMSSKEFKALCLEDTTSRKIDSVCTLHMQNGHFPGLVVSVTTKGNRIWAKGYGYANLETKVPVNPEESLFRIGSISKTVTASALARLYERGEIDLDVPIATYFKGCPADKGDLTLRQIGGHLAGIRHYRGFEFLSNIRYTNVTDPLQVFIHDTLLCRPGEQFNYSTYGWTLVSAVMEKSIQKPFTDIITDEVKKPLHLNDLNPDYSDSTSFMRVSFYAFQDSVLQPSPNVDNSNKWAGGGYLCTAEDLGKFGLAFVKPGYLKGKTIAAFTQSQTTNDGKVTGNGVGFWNGSDDKDRKWFGHSGGSVGGTSMLLIYPEQDLVIVTLVNMGGAEMNGLAGKIAELILSGKAKD